MTHTLLMPYNELSRFLMSQNQEISKKEQYNLNK